MIDFTGWGTSRNAATMITVLHQNTARKGEPPTNAPTNRHAKRLSFLLTRLSRAVRSYLAGFPSDSAANT